MSSLRLMPYRLRSKLYLLWYQQIFPLHKLGLLSVLLFLLKNIDVTLESVRLDKYYSCSTYVSRFGNAKVYVIPKKNATLKGSWKWKRTMMDFVKNTPEYLEEYYKREMSEAGFSADKRMFGWRVAQRKSERINCAQNCTAIWHNLLRLYP